MSPKQVRSFPKARKKLTVQENVSDKCRISTEKEQLKNKCKRIVNIRLNFALEEKKKIIRKKKDSDKEIEEELDHELNCLSKYSIKEMDGPNVSDIGFHKNTFSVHTFVLLKLNPIKSNRSTFHYIGGLNIDTYWLF